MAGKQYPFPQDFFKEIWGKMWRSKCTHVPPNLSPSSLMQTAGTSPVYRYSSSAPDTILRPYLHTNEPFQNNFSNVFGTNRLFSDIPFATAPTAHCQGIFCTHPRGNLPLPFCRNASDKLSSLPPSPSRGGVLGFATQGYGGPCWEEYMHLMLKLQLVFRWP